MFTNKPLHKNYFPKQYLNLKKNKNNINFEETNLEKRKFENVFLGNFQNKIICIIFHNLKLNKKN